jgi:hypothetical protein
MTWLGAPLNSSSVLTPSVLLPILYLSCECRGLLLTPLLDAPDAVSGAGLWEVEQLMGQEELPTALP